jgi:predicted acyl esterase
VLTPAPYLPFACARSRVRPGSGATTTSDAVVAVRVSDVAPDATETELTAGWLAGSFRKVDRSRSRYVRGHLLQPWHPFTEDSVKPVAPGKPTRLPVEIFPTSAAIAKGHRLKITIDPGDFPHQVPPLPQFAGSLDGQVQILTDPDHPSYVELPTLGRCRQGCRPLPVPNLLRGG